MKRLLSVVLICITIVTSNINVSAESVSNDNYKDMYRYSVLRLVCDYSITTVVSKTNGKVNMTMQSYRSQGTVFYIGDGNFVTAEHVVVADNDTAEYTASVIMRKNGINKELQSYELHLVSSDAKTDLAVLHTDDDTTALTALTLDDNTSTPKDLYSIGFPKDCGLTYSLYSWQYSTGVYEALSIMPSSTLVRYISKAYQISGGTIGGQSGSPVFNADQEVIGVLVCSDGTNSWCVPVSEITNLLNKEELK